MQSSCISFSLRMTTQGESLFHLSSKSLLRENLCFLFFLLSNHVGKFKIYTYHANSSWKYPSQEMMLRTYKIL